ncbi:MAG: hypothetical protein EHM28_01045 [Spirochaetaceae bacterium]|nr:MAG: hypothetical protein EHM28_01045 [Spirochaetaceae bacterium]
MKKAFIFSILLFSCCMVFTDNNFRDTKWGMSIEEVRKVEKSEYADATSDGLFFKTTIQNVDWIICYFFVDNKLYRAGYMTSENYTNTNKYFEIYNTFRDLLIDKYGQPIKEVITIPDIYKNHPDSGLLMGQVIYISHWDFTDITLDITAQGGDFKARVVILYANKELDAVKVQRDRDATKSQL